MCFIVKSLASTQRLLANDLQANHNFMGRAGLFRTKPKLSAEVLIHLATLLEFARHSSHKPNGNFLYRGKALELG
jgi:hypothetical protein